MRVGWGLDGSIMHAHPGSESSGKSRDLSASRSASRTRAITPSSGGDSPSVRNSIPATTDSRRCVASRNPSGSCNRLPNCRLACNKVRALSMWPAYGGLVRNGVAGSRSERCGKRTGVLHPFSLRGHKGKGLGRGAAGMKAPMGRGHLSVPVIRLLAVEGMLGLAPPQNLSSPVVGDGRRVALDPPRLARRLSGWRGRRH